MKKLFCIILSISMLYFSTISVFADEPMRAPVDPLDPNVDLISNTVVYGTKARVCPEFEGPCSISNSTSVTSSSSWSITVSASYKPLIIAQLEGELSISYLGESSYTNTFTVTYNVPEGKIGTIYFQPAYYNTKFTYYEPTYGTRTCILKTPKIVNGYTDGIYSYSER
ncbi:MAG: hypothetical protein ACI4WG_06000 [Erysipelotrichaceae bacterium]